MARDPFDQQAGFAGGYNSNGARMAVAANQFSAMFNVRVLPSGEIAKAPGVLSLANVHGGGFATLFLYRPTTGAMAVVSSDDGSLETGTFNGTSISPALSLTTRSAVTAQFFSVAHFRDASAECLYLACASGKLAKLQGSTFSDRTIGLPLALLHIWVYNQRLFGITGVDQTLYWSALNNGDTIGDTSLGGGSATIRTYGGQVLVNGFALGATNFLQHKTALSKFVGLTFDDIAIQAGAEGVSSSVGSLGLNSACVVDGVAYCVDRLGFYRMTEAGVERYESPETPDPVRQFLDSDATVQIQVNVAYNARMHEVWVSLSGTTNKVFIYSLGFQRFTGVLNSLGVTGMASMDDTAGATQLIIALESGKIGGVDFRRAASNTFSSINGGAYLSSVACRRLFTDASLSEKGWDTALVQAGSGGTLGTPQAVGTAIPPTLTYTTPTSGAVSQSTVALTSDRVTRVPLSGTGEWVDVTIADDGTSTVGWSIASVAVQGADLGAIGR